MGVNIKIPALVKSGETPISVFSRIHFVAKTLTDYLRSQQGDYVVNDAVSFMLKLGFNFLNVAETFLDIVKLRKDSNSAYALFRVQADYLATLLLIFENKPEDETKFRYLLYLLDGLSQRAESLKEKPPYNEDISKEDYDALIKQMTSAEKNAKDALDFCLETINKHPYKNINPILFNKIVEKRQWKYKEFNGTLTKLDFFHWKDLYPLIDKRPDIASFISLCSHYVHGNVNSLLSNTEDEDFDPIVSFDAMLIERYITMLKALYGNDKVNEILKFCLTGVIIKVC